MASDVDVVVTLPKHLRGAFKEPLGTIYTDPTDLLARVDGPLIAVGDIVTYHFERVGRTPDVAVVDGRTKRETVDEHVRKSVSTSARRVSVCNPAGTLSADLLSVLRDAVTHEEETVIAVDGEEDLVTLPAILAAPEGASVVYGQPDVGMVHVVVTDEAREQARTLLSGMNGDHERLWRVLGAD